MVGGTQADPDAVDVAVAGAGAAGVAASEEGAAAPVVAVDAAEVASEDAGAWLDFFDPSRKSVTYQPVPLSAKPAAVSCLTKRGAPHSGQSTSGGSYSFWRASF